MGRRPTAKNRVGIARAEMVERHLRGRGISDERVLAAMSRVRREEFVSEADRGRAYDDCPLPIGEGQTISQPYMVALITQCAALRSGEKVLEIGAGSGYQAAVLAEICSEVYAIERLPRLAERAAETLKRLGYDRVHVLVANGTEGCAAHAPYDRIVVSAAAPKVPEPLVEQLSEGGRLVVPVGSRYSQTLTVVEKLEENRTRSFQYCECIFVPLIGKHGWENM